MPTTPIAVLLYVLMLTPGILFLLRAESHRPRTSRSAFRETALVVIVSAFCAGLVIGLFILLTFPFPQLAEGASKFIRDPSLTLAEHPRQVPLWMGLFFLLTSAIGFIAGGDKIYQTLDRLIPKNERVFQGSAWQKILWDEDHDMVVGVQMKSGVWIEGLFAHHTHTDDDSGDRALVLQGPLSRKLKDAQASETVENFDRLVVQSSDIDYIASYPRARS